MRPPADTGPDTTADQPRITMGDPVDPVGAAPDVDEGRLLSAAVDRSTTPDRTPSAPAGRDDPDDTPQRPAMIHSNPPAATAAPIEIRAALRSLEENPVEGRRQLSRALKSGTVEPDVADEIRRRLSAVNEGLVFSQFIAQGDPFAFGYTLQSGDNLSIVAKRLSLQVDWRFIQRINGISDPNRIQVGQNLKLISGPFHVFIDKSDYRMDVYLGDGDDSVYVRSFPVGLGQYDSTPTGLFRVKRASKLIDPEWRNPQTNELYASDDPENPIGERWIGIEGIEEHTSGMSGFGIHGTIEPESIGSQASMGCIRMHHDDVVLTYEMLVEEVSAVRVAK